MKHRLLEGSKLCTLASLILATLFMSSCASPTNNATVAPTSAVRPTQTKASPAPAPKKMRDRKIAVQAYTFHKFTLEKTLLQLNEAGIKYVECYPDQKLSEKFPNALVGISLNSDERNYMKELLKDSGIQMVSFGVAGVKTEEEIIKNFEFAKEMGAGQIVTEADLKQIPVWIKYSEIYGIPMALHFHQINYHNQYYSPDVMIYLTTHFKVNASPDIGHWARSGVNPIYGLKALRGKFPYSLHFKDQKTFDDLQSDCAVLGEGVLDIKGILAELDKQDFDGYIVIEHEAKADEDNPLPAVIKCAEYLKKN